MGNKIVVLVLAGFLFASPLHAEVAAPVAQSSSGNQSPVINTGGDATVNYGLNEEKLKAILQEREDNLVRKLRAAGSDEQERRLLEEQLKGVQAQKDDLKKSLEEEIARRKAADKALTEMKGQLPDTRIAEGKKSLEQGDTKAAEQVFDEVVDKEGKHVALAAYQSGQLAEGRLDYAKAMRQYRKAVTLEEDKPDYLLAAGKMARTVADYGHAQEWLERLLKMREAEGKNDLTLAYAVHEVADVYYFQSKYEQAEPLYKRSLEISEKTLGKDHPSVATTLNNLAELYQAQGKYAEAEPLYKRSLEISEKTLGKDHPDVAATLNNLAELYQAQGKYAEAAPLYKRSLEIYEKTLGKDHPDVATTLNNLAELYQAQGKYAEAAPLYKRSLEIYEKTLDKDHPWVATTKNNLANLYYQQKKYTEAEPLYKRSLEIKEKSLGKDHPLVAATLNNLAELYKTQGRYEEAEPLYKRSLEIYEKTLGKDHPDVATTLNNLAGLYYKQGKYKEAEPLYKRALAIFMAKLPAGHPNIKTVQRNYDDMKRKMESR
jgi:tetratricopeptide (TPR) repeat protein